MPLGAPFLLSLRLGGMCDLLLINRIWHRWESITPVIMVHCTAKVQGCFVTKSPIQLAFSYSKGKLSCVGLTSPGKPFKRRSRGTWLEASASLLLSVCVGVAGFEEPSCREFRRGKKRNCADSLRKLKRGSFNSQACRGECNLEQLDFSFGSPEQRIQPRGALTSAPQKLYDNKLVLW